MANNKNNNLNPEELAKKYLNGTITPEEQARFEDWYADFDDEKVELDCSRYNSIEELKSSIYREIQKRIHPKRNASNLWLKTAAAALVLVFFALVFYLTLSPKGADNSNHLVGKQAKDFGPGGNSASLTLQDGSEINLDELADGEKFETKNAVFRKNDNGELELIVVRQGQPSLLSASELAYHTIRTPRGGNYKIILADDTEVWLNSSSSLRFPNNFNGDERRVELIGEAYFNVKKNTESPFIVVSKGQQIRVLGTEFNVSAYSEDEITKTTLIEGSIKISTEEGNSKIMLPGEQAHMHRNGSLAVNTVDVNHVKAWKDGYFAFDKLSVEEVMDQISRWYDVKVTYEGKTTRKQLVGQISKKENLETVLKMLEYNGMNLEFQNHSIVVK